MIYTYTTLKIRRSQEMTKKIKKLEQKILERRRKLIDACLRHDEKKIIKHQHKLLKLHLHQASKD